ncbi:MULTISPECIES: amylo-alpha-1,6-glucosidase [unclassified Tolypothrix]|uniref:amylo-alpha-1,6-glucosidase n=1 Tax=unclassified Tolypothrix TaxID=2649714 RepID=UPI0005EAA61E|nr:MULTISPECIES: amylo-alpha-1,6-glucosidase [unclassified Tolypothrix]BAY92712.1 putative glycogen debranching enzyme [Microchaete diplosiphon NIES-3275]EKF05818.1 putative glycogen debranching enzyme, type [Tolypothrix sp. PCC 7601]MBE9081472.1 amylo-alpha-1,6-glucosidase [Tolypothrix sp. LEGE 11397]UYD26643.1 amylo-alpha-1,6-glucosidase [Tolypothrix sp. PCC 7712]UYD37498.1 amylo-alpha-1,6-glucosidase [Tolypothrix sp. PCC 7601]
MGIEFGREICGNLDTAESREWLVTNGIGGYASGTVAGLLTRRYHGLLVAALQPPLGRTLMLVKLDETVLYDTCSYSLNTNRWVDGIVSPHGYQHIERFSLEGTIPVWRFAIADALLEKRVWMQQGVNTTYVQYTLRRATKPLKLALKAIVNYRDYHGDTQSNGWQMSVEQIEQGICVTAYPGAVPLYLLSDCGSASPVHNWYYGFDLAVERDRGLSDKEDHLHAATFEVTLNPGEAITFVASTQKQLDLNAEAALEHRQALEQKLIGLWKSSSSLNNPDSPAWVNRLVLAADQFIVDRSIPENLNGKTIIAGYHWFGDWGRDTMISLPGLTLATNRPEIARYILRTFARYVDQGMLPNRFPDAGEIPEYNTVDATLWYFEAIRAYYNVTEDDDLLMELFPVLADIINWHCRGTRYNIHLDSTDGLLYAGQKGVQLTWMDAKVGDWVVTPRIGKPIEVNALWYNALRTMTNFARYLSKPHQEYEAIADRIQVRFSRFWNQDTGYCYDVLDSPDGNDPSLRPNQIFAVSLPETPLTPAQQRGVVDICGQILLTSHGLRSLNPDHSKYQGKYGGNQYQRDGAYHQGTVWGWLLGPFVLAHLRVYKNPQQARQFLQPIANHLTAHGLGSLSEIFDGDAPMTPRGCIAQAWTVAEVLRAWLATEG